MNRLVLLILLTFSLTGCRWHAPTPTFDPFSVMGPQRIPPPGTNSYGTTDPYYGSGGGAPAVTLPGPAGSPAPATNPASPQLQPMTPSSTQSQLPLQSSQAPALSDLTTAAPGGAMSDSTGLVWHKSGGAAPNVQPVQPAAGVATIRPSRPLSGGMHVNDATLPAEPQPFTPLGQPIRIVPIPQAAAAPPVSASLTAATEPANGWTRRSRDRQLVDRQITPSSVAAAEGQ